MYFKIQVVIDAAEPAKLAEFWALALDYVLEPPPHGFETWEDFGRSIGMPEEEFGDQAAVIDPADEGPRIYFQRVPERPRLSCSHCSWIAVLGLSTSVRRPSRRAISRPRTVLPEPGGMTR